MLEERGTKYRFSYVNDSFLRISTQNAILRKIRDSGAFGVKECSSQRLMRSSHQILTSVYKSP